MNNVANLYTKTIPVTADEFAQEMFRDKAPDDLMWVTGFNDDPSKPDSGAAWKGGATSVFKPLDNTEVKANLYISTATFPSGTKARSMKHFQAMHLLVLDDAKYANLPPTYVLETSQGKHHFGYRMRAPLKDLETANALVKAVAEASGADADKSGNNAVRYVRLPQGFNTKGGGCFENVMRVWEPDLCYSVEELVAGLGLDLEAQRRQLSTGKPPEHYESLFINAVEKEGGRLRQGDGRHQMLNEYIGWHLKKHEPEAVVAMVQAQVAKHFDTDDFDKTLAEAERQVWDFHGRDLAVKADGGGEVHPLAQFKPLDEVPRAPTFLIEGVLTDKLSVLGSYPGKGKTSAWVSVCLTVCGAMQVADLNVKVPRHVIYVSEHPEQVQNLLSGLREQNLVDWGVVCERFHLVESKRLTPAELVKVAPVYQSMAQEVCRNDVCVTKTPYLVLDTAAATLEVDDENDNAGWSRAIATLKDYLKIPTTIILHTSKAHKHGKAEDMTIRGASSIEGDVAQVMFLSVDDNDDRYIEVGIPKHRFEASVDAIRIISLRVDVVCRDEFNEACVVPVRVAELEPLTIDQRAAVAAQNKALEEQLKVDNARAALRVHLQDLEPDQKEVTQADIEQMSKEACAEIFPTTEALRRNNTLGTNEAVRKAIAEMKVAGELNVGATPPRGLKLPGGRKYVVYTGMVNPLR